MGGFLFTFFFRNFRQMCLTIRKAEGSLKMAETAVIILNIPASFNTGDLRRFFTDFAETGKFSTFHYKRRPLAHLIKKASSSSLDVTTSAVRTVYDAVVAQCPQHSEYKSTNLGLAKVPTAHLQSFLEKYHSRLWMGQDEEEMTTRCMVAHLPFSEHFKELREFCVGGGGLCPQGNVGTPTKMLREAVRQCRMPSKMIGKLGIGPAAGATGKGLLRYAAVAPPSIEHDNPNGRTLNGKEGSGRASASTNSTATTSHANEDNDLGEEWERHECLHDDVSARRQLPRAHDSDWADCLEHQPGTKERLFEEDMEVTWEKGGSGLVFYTDAQFWHAQLDPEERNTDDWDVDTSVYYGGTDSDRDSRDMRDMNLPQDDRCQSVFTKRKMDPEKSGKKHHRYHPSPQKAGHSSYNNKSSSRNSPAAGNKSSNVGFKKPKTQISGRFAGNSFSRKLMAQQGWKAGQGLGVRSSGITDPVDTRGQMTRAGLGYKETEENNIAWNAKPSTSTSSNNK